MGYMGYMRYKGKMRITVYQIYQFHPMRLIHQIFYYLCRLIF